MSGAMTESTLKEKMFPWPLSFRGFSPWLSGSKLKVFGIMGEEISSVYGSQKQKKSGREPKEDTRNQTVPTIMPP